MKKSLLICLPQEQKTSGGDTTPLKIHRHKKCRPIFRPSGIVIVMHIMSAADQPNRWWLTINRPP
ncbi:MAG: hypothetical protein ACRCT2_12240, partial [Plesiomonas shigelloides]